MYMRILLIQKPPWKVLLGVILLSITQVTWSAHFKQHQLVDDLDIFLTVVPAEMIRGHPKEHFESQMHGGVPSDEHYHVMVALFNHNTKQRVTDAKVMAKVISVNYTGPLLKLEHMILVGETSFGNYLTVPANEAFNIALQIQVNGKEDVTNVRFVWART